MTFKRYLNTGDPTDAVLKREMDLPLIWAYGFPDRAYHGTRNRGYQTILFDQTLPTGASELIISLAGLLSLTLLSLVI
jgi:hypothetical protein